MENGFGHVGQPKSTQPGMRCEMGDFLQSRYVLCFLILVILSYVGLDGYPLMVTLNG